jgi:Spy/CpxP family protein refolding chaperone
MKNFIGIFLILFFFTAGFSFAQRDGKRKTSDGLDKVLKQKVMEKLNFDESTADRLLLAYQDNKKQMRAINKERKEIMESIELDPGATDIELKLEKMLEIETKIADLRKNFFTELKTFLTPQQIANTLILRKNFHKELRKQMSKQRKRDKPKEKENENN